MEFRYTIGDKVKLFERTNSYTGTVTKQFESLIGKNKYEISIDGEGRSVVKYEDEIIEVYNPNKG